MRLPLVVGVVSILSVPCAPSQGDQPRWRSTGPAGDDARIVAIDPSDPDVLYATVGTVASIYERRLFRSRDGGATWSAIPLPDHSVVAVAVDAHDGRTLYVSALNRTAPANDPDFGWRVLKSVDGGATFTRLAFPEVRANNVRQLIASSRPGTIWAVTSFPTLFRTTDGGATWQYRSGGYHPFNVVVSPSHPDVIYALLQECSCLARSVDGGERWRVIKGSADAVAVDPADPDVVYTVVDNEVLKTVDGGSTWSPANHGIDPWTRPYYSPDWSLAIDPLVPSRVFASWTIGVVADRFDRYAAFRLPLEGRLFVTENSGASWRPVPSSTCPAIGGPLRVGGDASLYVSVPYRGIVRTRDGGLSFEESTRVSRAAVHALLIDPEHPGIALAATSGLLARTTDRGGTWAAFGSSSVVSGCPEGVLALSAGPAGSGARYAATFTDALGSVDGGRSWRPLGTAGSPGLLRPTALAADPRSGGTLFVARHGEIPQDGAPQRDDSGLFRSADGGATFLKIMSVDAGYDHPVRTVTFDPSDPKVVFAGGGKGVFRSTDGGIRFERLPPPRPADRGDPYEVTAISVHPTDAGQLVAATDGAGVFRSTDGGTTWKRSNAGLPSTTTGGIAIYPSIRQLVRDPDSPGTIWAGASTFNPRDRRPTYSYPLPSSAKPEPGGAFVSHDGGNTWSALAEGLEGAEVTSLALETRGARVLYAGTDRGVFTLPLSSASVASVSPQTGSVEGGTLVLVKGRGFGPDSRVLFDGEPGTEFTFFDATTLRVRTPPHAAGASSVTVSDADGSSSAPLPDVFRYEDWAPRCQEGAGSICLERGRFLVRVERPDFSLANALPITGRTGSFWLSIYEGLDVAVKVLDGRTIDGRYWIHHAGLTESPYTLVVTDTVTGKTVRYSHAAGPPASAIDRTSFP